MGIRWFSGGAQGIPSSYDKPIWLIIPDLLYNALLNGLPLEFQFRDRINRFLAGELAGDEI
ncbi:hypothetical protein FACS1894162_4840 [Bacteroidia bacterium]|nr:hypothetical protein FACS1894162_4840 [Bacteroidia bacterium]